MSAPRRHPLSIQPEPPYRTPAARIREFMDELDDRIAGKRGVHSKESRTLMAQLRPNLVKKASADPDGFAAELERQIAYVRSTDEEPS